MRRYLLLPPFLPSFLSLCLVSLAACSDPLATVPRLADVDVQTPTPVVEAIAAPAETAPNTGFMARILRKRELAPTAVPPASATPLADAAPLTDAAPQPTAEPTAETTATNDTSKPRRLWPFGKSSGKSKSRGADQPAAEPLLAVDREKQPPDTAQKASFTPEAATDAAANDAPQKRARSGLFSRRKAARLTGPDAQEVAPGTVLPFGEIARVCAISKRDMGREVAKYPERGSRYRLFDSEPGNVGPHVFYMTGFSDGCPRQFTAALALFGSASMHETLRYGLPEKSKPYSATDTAYEKVKRRVCGAGKNKPCGSKISKLEKDTVFLSIYNRFGAPSGWSNLLLSDGEVLALDRKGG